jgi:O-antigen/teichoic acid export membrane protein
MPPDSSPRAGSTLRKLAVNASAMAVAGVIAQICFTTIESIIARRLGQHAYGVYGSVYALSMSTAWLVDLGMAWKLIQDGSRQPATIPSLLGTTMVLKAVFACVLGPVMALALGTFGYNTEIRGLFGIFFGYAVLLVMQDSLAAVYSARQRMHVTALFQGAAPVAILICILFAGLTSQSLAGVGVAYLVGGGLVTAIWAWRTFVFERPRVELRRSREILQGSWHYGLTGALSQVYLRVDLLLLPLLRNLAEVGLFAAADKVTDLGLKVGVLCTRVLAPVMFAQSHEDPASYARTCKIALRTASLAGTLGCLVLAFLAEPLVTLIFGAAFRPAAAILVVLAASLAVRLIVIALQVVLSASDQHVRRTGALAFAIGGAGTFNLLLVPTYGAVGAAAARLVSDVIHVIVMVSARGLPFHRRAAVGWMLAPPLLGACAYLAAQTLHADLILSTITGVGLYGLGVVALRAVRLTELREVAHYLRARASR